MRTSWIAPLAALGLAFAAAGHAETKAESSPDKGFVQQALKSGEEEVALAKLAVEKAQSSDLKQLAQMLVSDHSAVNEQLRLLARRNGAASPPADAQKQGAEGTRPPETAPGAAPTWPKAAELGRLSGEDFERRFLAMIVEGHEKSVELYGTEAERGTDPAAKKLAAETLPKIKAHLQQAKSLQEQISDKKAR